jgi:hypothetical protein
MTGCNIRFADRGIERAIVEFDVEALYPSTDG